MMGFNLVDPYRRSPSIEGANDTPAAAAVHRRYCCRKGAAVRRSYYEKAGALRIMKSLNKRSILGSTIFRFSPSQPNSRTFII
jgi:hypothetical protein